MELKFKSFEDLQSYLTEVDMIELEDLTDTILRGNSTDEEDEGGWKNE